MVQKHEYYNRRNYVWEFEIKHIRICKRKSRLEQSCRKWRHGFNKTSPVILAQDYADNVFFLECVYKTNNKKISLNFSGCLTWWAQENIQYYLPIMIPLIIFWKCSEWAVVAFEYRYAYRESNWRRIEQITSENTYTNKTLVHIGSLVKWI